MSVSVDNMDEAIMEGLQEYASLAADEMKEACRSAAKTVRKEIQANAPVDTGAYKKSWAVKKVSEDSQSIDLVVHSKNRYQIAHLLEYGHAKRNGGRVPAQPHIKDAEAAGEEQLMEDIKNALSK